MVDEAGQVVSIAEVAVRPEYLAGGGVEQDPEALFNSVVGAGREALAQAGIPVAAVALANQGETVLAWDPDTGRPLTPALVWQDRRAEAICADAVGVRGHRSPSAPGLCVDPYFSAPKMAWLRDEHDHGRCGHHHRHLAGAPAVRRVRHRRIHRQPVAADRLLTPSRGTPTLVELVRPRRRSAARHRRQRRRSLAAQTSSDRRFPSPG